MECLLGLLPYVLCLYWGLGLGSYAGDHDIAAGDDGGESDDDGTVRTKMG